MTCACVAIVSTQVMVESLSSEKGNLRNGHGRRMDAEEYRRE